MKSRASLLASTLGLAVLTTTALHATAPSANAQAGFGTIKGRLVWGGAKVPTPEIKVKKGDPNAKDAGVCAVDEIPDEKFVIDATTKGVADCFAYVVGPKGSNPDAEAALLKARPTVVMDQKNCRFIPHVVAVFKDQPLIFKSSDPVGHNVHYNGFQIESLNQMVAANGQLKVTFAKTETAPSEVRCDLHPWMNGYFMVFDHPFFAITKADGTFEIKGVPAGAQKIIVRHPANGYVTTGARRGQEIEVLAGAVVDLGDLMVVPKGGG